jgi:alpha-D-xyloside xylohydrolase
MAETLRGGLSLGMSGFGFCSHDIGGFEQAAADEAHQTRAPILRSMLLKFADDPACDKRDPQYMLGHSLLVATVFAHDGTVGSYLPMGRSVEILNGQAVDGPRWVRWHV